jgi:tRNA U54 and U55 pseudouridine synthase Pus10
MKVIESAIKLMKKGYVCDYCLGRAFGNLLTGKSNKERGEAIRQVLAMVFDSGENLDIDLSNFYSINLRNRKVEVEKKTCYFCNGIFEKIEEIADKIIEKLKEYEFDTFLIGTKLSHELLQKEEEMIEEVGAEFYESLKSTLNREIGKIVERKTGKKADRNYPDITILVDLEKNTISLQVKSLFVYGEYQKLSRSIPQATWYCPYCKGKGCEKCKGTGLLYPTSVQMIIEKPLLKVAKGKKSKIHGCVASDTKILLSNNLSIPIEKLDGNWENYEILTFDINKKRVVPSKLVDFVKINLDGSGLKVFEITTKETGRKIIATADHAFLTPKGMLPLSEIKVGDKVAVYPLEALTSQIKDEIIISEDNVLDTIQRLQPKLVFRTNAKKVIRELKERGLLSISTQNLKKGIVWETIEEIKEVKVPHVFDITTRSRTHTFIANGFIVSNSGREDIDARCLAWRPFIIEIVKPKIRKIDLKEIEKKINKSKKVKVRNLKIIKDGKQLIRKIKTERSEKTYRAIVTFEKPIDKEKLKELKQLNGAIIFQKTPTRVLARRSDKERKRKVIKISYKLVNKKTLELTIRASAGLYIKELISGDNGRTKPNISEILNNIPKKILLDVIKIHRGG